MASIRELKKDVNYLAYELLTEAFAYKHFHSDLDEKKFDEVIRNLVELRNELISKINKYNAEGKPVKSKEYFKKIQSELVELVKTINKLTK